MSRRFPCVRAGLLGLALLVAVPAPAADDPDVLRLQARLEALQADPDVARLAPFEQMQAREALAALAAARRAARPEALYLAERRVEIAELAVRTEAARQELARLDQRRTELLLEASRREAEEARREAERLRIQAQIQAEEAERLRLAAEAEAAARTEAEQALGKAASRQSAQLSAARRKEAELARQEAELVSGKKLPPARFDGQSEVFTLPGSAYAAGKGALSASGKDAAAALAAYLQINTRNVRVQAWSQDAKLAQARAQALREALVQAGVPAARIKAEGRSGPASAQRAAEVVVAP
ncbi:OmpA family protein [Pseudoxanthomonas taiwanensis]|jgi:OmpA family.|uniref:OmpA-like domain-containing protein n=1 Tax=Pseudoxanthomonas taiwanensis TaxID=176598 RepID=A0A921TG53_9GAMM|nr:OmpA family protein [Pseudoxanthomonas taiwanensis]KAF1689910.1 hypothetical protein CR938_04050 [Pseudoxanthomonas taiwanensis]MBO2468085.1 hypothetical protein [Xanthomonadaceae bacterium]